MSKKQEATPKYFAHEFGREYPDPSWTMDVAAVDRPSALLGNSFERRSGNLGGGGIIVSGHFCQSVAPAYGITSEPVDEPN